MTEKPNKVLLAASMEVKNYRTLLVNKINAIHQTITLKGKEGVPVKDLDVALSELTSLGNTFNHYKANYESLYNQARSTGELSSSDEQT